MLVQDLMMNDDENDFVLFDLLIHDELNRKKNDVDMNEVYQHDIELIRSTGFYMMSIKLNLMKFALIYNLFIQIEQMNMNNFKSLSKNCLTHIVV